MSIYPTRTTATGLVYDDQPKKVLHFGVFKSLILKSQHARIR